MSTKTANVLACMQAVEKCLGDRFVLIGGAAMQLFDSTRTTNDVDILVSAKENVSSLVSLLADQHGFSNTGGELRFGDGETVTVDILTTAVETVTLENLGHNLLSVGRIRIPNLDYALAMKIKCFYLRQDDENGQEKRRGDAFDVEFLCRRMVLDAQTISDQCAEKFKFGFYHILELRQELSDQAVSDFISIGGRKLILPWEQNTPEQREYFEYFADSGVDPLSVKLEQ
ncbi:hypothetical protein ACJ72_06951 [Emergomyces africanus]|uniref:Uncharacterized protein n=1 Tax=Emergomyces africanus TaxID=1955775 RepID=A0A1B7NPJ5_9EURO|nr:hypothetical protein ACJ72_06951 [Emergomyces africanus]